MTAACPECGAAPAPIGTILVVRHAPDCTWQQDIAEDRAADLRNWP